MKHTLLLLLSTLFLLFTMATSQKPVNGVACALKSELKAADEYKKIKRPCPKKCLKHQTHSEQKNAANVTLDCGQQLFAVVHDIQSELFSASSAEQQFKLLAPPKLLAPSLGADPDPPRFS